MRNLSFPAVVIGGGAAGMAAANEIAQAGYQVALIERERTLGGILMQCIHNGFGVHEFKEELTGPEYAERWENIVQNQKIDIFCDTTVIELSENGNQKTAVCVSPSQGMFHIDCTVIVLAAGCRERNRGGVQIPGSRPAGVYTAGLAQRMINMEGYLPGKEAVIVGSGDIGLIMARRMMWSGCKVHGVVEIQPYPSGLTRNISQCLQDFSIPLYLSHIISKIYGKHRIEAVDITPLKEGQADYDSTFQQACDTLLLSVGLIPSQELIKPLKVHINPLTNGPQVDGRLMTSIPGIFACGNVLHVHDLVDFVSAEAKRAGRHAAEFLGGYQPRIQIRIKAGSNIRYTAPSAFNPERPETLYFRPMIVKNKAEVQVLIHNEVIRTFKKSHVQPSEMIEIDTSKLSISVDDVDLSTVMEVRLQ